MFYHLYIFAALAVASGVQVATAQSNTHWTPAPQGGTEKTKCGGDDNSQYGIGLTRDLNPGTQEQVVIIRNTGELFAKKTVQQDDVTLVCGGDYGTDLEVQCDTNNAPTGINGGLSGLAVQIAAPCAKQNPTFLQADNATNLLEIFYCCDLL